MTLDHEESTVARNAGESVPAAPGKPDRAAPKSPGDPPPDVPLSWLCRVFGIGCPPAAEQ